MRQGLAVCAQRPSPWGRCRGNVGKEQLDQRWLSVTSVVASERIYNVFMGPVRLTIWFQSSSPRAVDVQVRGGL